MEPMWWTVTWAGAAISVLLSVLLVVVLVLLIIKLATGRSSGGSRRESAGLRVLDELYAKGEITRDEYLERKAVLRQ